MAGGSDSLWCDGRRWPAPADEHAAERLLERFAETGAAEADLAAQPAAQSMLRALGGNAPYLADLCVREHGAARAIAAGGPDGVVADAMAALAGVAADAPRARIAAGLRQAKRICGLAIAVADIGGAWHLDRVTAALSDLAEAALRVALAHAVHTVVGDAADPAAPGIVVLGMGKLGGRELNYSSDIDLVLLHDPLAWVREAGRDDSSTALSTRIVRSLVALLEARDADGYVFRTDLRLRPDPAATPPSVSWPAAIAYYEGMAQSWERAVMLKARPVAGDLALGARFLEAIRPFVWRRGLDFSAIADFAATKRRIDAHKGAAEPAGDAVARLLGRDLKLGPGGIREIEFCAQTLQLVWGGRDPSLRIPRTVEALRRLSRAGHLPARAAGELIAAYCTLRRVEHRLQMVADRQTHSLPATVEGLDRFTVFMGGDLHGFATVLVRHIDRVRRRYADFFADAAPDAGALSIPALAGMGFADPAHVQEVLERWRGGGMRALRSERSRALLAALTPALLRALARQAQPDRALARLDHLLSALPAGVPVLSLFQRHAALLDRVADVLGAAPSLADYMATHTDALDGLLNAPAAGGIAARLGARLVDARGLEDAIAIVRRTVREEDFATSVATLEGRLDADAAGVARAELADAAIAALLPWALADTERRHGVVPGGELVVVLLGKAGGREMMAGSDLDLMLVYDHPPEVGQSDVAGGGRALPPSQWFSRAVSAFVSALTAPDAGGALYAIVMRLRPSGNKGPVAVSRAAFARYHAAGGDAWTWERMALTRARVVAGSPALARTMRGLIGEALAAAGDAIQVRRDAADMRARLWRDARPPGPPFALSDLKLRPGGLVEVEFCAQVLQLGRPDLHSPNTAEALAKLAAVGALAEADAALLIRAGRAYRTVLGLVRLTVGRQGDAGLSGASAESLLLAARAVGLEALDLGGLRVTLEALAGQVRAVFTRLVGPVSEERGI
jgi:glutamate-ammonia-ligase adenylyltransferase